MKTVGRGLHLGVNKGRLRNRREEDLPFANGYYGKFSSYSKFLVKCLFNYRTTQLQYNQFYFAKFIILIESILF